MTKSLDEIIRMLKTYKYFVFPGMGHGPRKNLLITHRNLLRQQQQRQGQLLGKLPLLMNCQVCFASL
jgi:hypothetical protein